MALYADNLIDERTGLPIEGAQLYVYDNVNAEATLTDALDQPLTQPLLTDANGAFEYKAADGIYRHDFWKNAVMIYRENRVIVGTPATVTASLGAFGTTLIGNATAADARTDLDVYSTSELSAAIGSSLVGFQQAGTGAVATDVEEELRNITLTPEQFGAIGNILANDTIAFQRLAAAVNTLGGCSIRFGRNRTYTVGAQNFAGANGLGYAYQAQAILRIENCTKPVVIDMNGSTMKLASGLKFGSFNPVTGAAIASVAPYYINDSKSDIGIMIEATNCAALEIKNGELDGNIQNTNIGGQWGDLGWQRAGDGIVLTDCDRIKISSVYIHHHCRDGYMSMYSGNVSGSTANLMTFSDVISDYNARQGFSWVGGHNLVAINCKFNHTGRSVIASAPAAGIDIEAEGGTLIRRGYFLNCEFADCAGNAVLADAGNSADIVFENCRIYGTTTFSMWIKKNGFRFVRCLISGEALTNRLTGIAERDTPIYDQCLFTPESFEGRPVFGAQLFSDEFGSIFNRCHFVTMNAAIHLGSSVAASTRYNGCTFLQNGSTADAFIRGRFEGTNTFTITTGRIDANGSSNTGFANVTGTMVGVLFTDSTFIATQSPAYAVQSFYSNDGASGRINKQESNFAAPSSGTYKRGDRVLNANPAIGGPTGWICTVAGSPGTWEELGIVGAVRAASQPNAAGANPTKAEYDALLSALRTAGLMV
jgi:hypothetical protein